MKILLPRARAAVFAAAFALSLSCSALAEEAKEKTAVEPAPGVVVTSEDASQKCLLPVVVTAVDGNDLKDTDQSGRFEFEPGPHTISGHAGGDPGLCSTFAGKHASLLREGARIGESTYQLDVEPGKEYTLGVDVRSEDQSRWKIVAWKIRH